MNPFRLTLIALIATAPAAGRPPAPPARSVEPVLATLATLPDIGDDQPPRQVEPIDEKAAELRELGQGAFAVAGYELMAAAYAELCARPSATFEDHLWHGHAHQLAREWPAACRAYQGALNRLDAEIESTESELAAFEELAKRDESIKFRKGSRYPFLKRAQQLFPQQWPDLVLQIGQLELVELKDPAAAAKTLAKGLRFAPELAVPLDQLTASAKAALEKKPDPADGTRALAFIVPLEAQRFLAMAQEQLDEPAAAFETWVRVRLSKIAYPSSYAATDPVHLKELAGKLPQKPLPPHDEFAIQHPDREPLKQREARAFLKSGAGNPFQAAALQGFDFTGMGPAAASLARLRDGRLLMACTTGDQYQTRIKLSLSRDGGAWLAPWEFAHNSIFNTRAPSLLVDDDGEIWMLCLSQRLTIRRFASAPYALWLTHSRDGREWAPLRSLQMLRESSPPQIASAQYQEIPQLLRLPAGRFGVLWGAHFGAAASLSELSSLGPLSLPLTNQQPVVCNTQATFDAAGRCHLVFDDFGRGLFYTSSDDMETWLPLQNLGVAEKNASISMPQLLLEGDRAALLYERSSGLWLQRGTLAAEGLKLADAIQITDHQMPLSGSRLRRDGDRVLIPAGTAPYVPNLLTAPLQELLTAPPYKNPK